MTNAIETDLEIARQLATAGIPVFCAYPDPEGKTPSGRQTGFILPKGWESTSANPAYVDAWKPGMALCAVMGNGLDLIDIDPRNGGDSGQLNGLMPAIYAEAASPSGGTHKFIASTGVRSRDAVFPGIDIKAGDPEGRGRGYAFIAPTVRPSKVTGELTAYQWTRPPDADLLKATAHDTTGQQLAAMIQSRGRHRQAGSLFTQPDTRHAGPIPYGEHHTQLVAYAGSLRARSIPPHEAETLMLRRLQDCVQPPGASRERYTEAGALAELHDIYGRYAAGDPAAGHAGSPDSAPVPGLPDIDLGALAAIGISKPERIADGMLYPGCVHCLAGTPGGGKTTLMAWWMLRHIREGGHVMLLDEESGAEQAAEKFLDLGATPEELSPPRLTYVPFPSRGWNTTDLTQLHDRVTERKPGIIGWDSVAAFLAIAGADENSAADVTAFWQKVLMPCARQFGAAVVAIDHTVKSGEHGGYGRGSGAKKAASDVQYIIETVRPFNRTQSGTLRLTTSPGKDRRGWLAVAYEIHVKVDAQIVLEISEADAAQAAVRKEMSPAKAKLHEALNAISTPEAPVTASQLVDWIERKYGHGLRRPTCSKNLNELADEGLADSADPGPGREKLWFTLTPSASDDASALTRLSASPPLRGDDDGDGYASAPFRQPGGHP